MSAVHNSNQNLDIIHYGRTRLISEKMGPQRWGKDFSERVWNVKKMQDRVLSEPLIVWGAVFSFARERGAFFLCHKTKRMEWRRGMGASVVDAAQPLLRPRNKAVLTHLIWTSERV
jgi:hypothetical protein